MIELRKAVKTTEYPNQDEMVRDRIVIGLRETVSKEKLMREPSLTLTKAINFCRATETSKDQVKTLDNESRLDAVRASTSRIESRTFNKPVCDKDPTKPCKSCGYKHKFENKCPAAGKTCAKCQGRDHFAKVCPNKSERNDSHRNKVYKKKVNCVGKESSSESTEESDHEFYISAINSSGRSKSNTETMWTKEIWIKGKPITFKLDTGAEVSTLPLNVLKKIAPRLPIRKTNVTLMSYGDPNFKLQCFGEVVLECKVKECVEKVPFVVVSAQSKIPVRVARMFKIKTD